MNQELKAKWVEELRSGKIVQGKKALLNEKGEMCCIGVLGRLCGIPDEVLLRRATFLKGEGLTALSVLEKDAPWDLANMNDGGKTFTEIADYIEKNL